MEMLQDNDLGVRMNAVNAFGLYQQNPQATHALLPLLDEQYRLLRPEVIMALGTMKDPQAVPALVQVFGQEKDEETRVAIVNALGRIGGPQATEVLVKLSGDKSTQVRLAAVYGIAAAGSSDLAVLLEPFMKDRDKQVRESAQQILNRGKQNPPGDYKRP